MNDQGTTIYGRIAEAVGYIQQNSGEQPTPEEVAGKVHLSPTDFEKLFVDWAGVTPEKFQEYISVRRAKQILNNLQPTLFETPTKPGISGTAGSHDAFTKIERMTPAEYENKGECLTINYSFSESLFGGILAASTHKGICYLAFSDDKQTAMSNLEKRFSIARFIEQADDIQQNALHAFTQDWSKIHKIKLHLKGTDFQLKVWEALLKIPMGGLATYGNIAEIIRQPKAARAVGTAIGSNPVAFLIPCHRVIQSSGVFGGYMWGTTRKAAMIGWEASKVDASATKTGRYGRGTATSEHHVRIYS
ncbi:MAG: bifunctional helix-turn-helix domain-containing protein/methylated-DNA--[protein]-cysteine S-methyltransferase [Bacteroidales bacterium]|jgi:AraC family transcriptional regulator of adaptative response/methylated-DNA-[protein]-cysteine methyltransferase|nr:bifunctional helix-turn-helix domain-containing protein/methylated-DNA--[protein]-cysteine S-methyltransferase [Bacteroidales bacterium]MDD3130297.1 bifunctional helix-turn-helix domain-containing protein/methylated-DNA--[protein]-cysteine S-methyltransferase [Bacteroidales bacterium]MDY0334091.1 bifunctional helix-turn-helix domain-containing protein/methylated-DNA--[protein]-cysteine S-methyltransferase [Bacteroidales bacterium]NLO50581.1 methylated-DNA--[protein]-cysteine S-methyltransfera